MSPADAIALADFVFGALVVLVIAGAYVAGHREGYAAAMDDVA